MCSFFSCISFDDFLFSVVNVCSLRPRLSVTSLDQVQSDLWFATTWGRRNSGGGRAGAGSKRVEDEGNL